MKAKRAAAILVVLTALAAGAAWQRVSIVREGYAITRLRRQRDVLEEYQQTVRCEIAALSAPEAIAERLDKFDVELMRPSGLEPLDGSGHLEARPAMVAKQDGNPPRRNGAKVSHAR